MRVLMVVEACGGVARHVSDLCAGLHRRGITVHLCYSPVRADENLRAGLSRLQALGVPTCAVPMEPAPRLSDIFAWRAIRHYTRLNGPFDVIHGHSSKGGALVRLLPGGSPVKIYSPHAFVTMNPLLGVVRHNFYRIVEKVLARVGDAVVTTSPAEYTHARTSLRLPEKQLFLVTNGIDPTVSGEHTLRTELRNTWQISESEIVIGSMGRFVPQKAPEVLLRAFAKVRELHPQTRLVMAGEGPQQRELEQTAERLGVAAAVTWAGHIEAPGFLAAIDVFALASRYEGFPYVLLEALAAGLPLVATAVGGAEQVIHDGVNGFVVSVDRDDLVAERLCRLAGDADERSRMGKASRERISRFSVDRMVEETLEIYGLYCGSGQHGE